MHRDPLSISWELAYVIRGEHTIQWDWQKGITAVQQRTPSGIAEQNWRLSSELGWQVIKPLELTLLGALQGVQNVDHQSGNTAFGAEITISARYIF
jgi:hypothetical protein